jgi:hypothetical protein
MIRRNFLALQKNSLGQAAQVLFEGELTSDVTFTASWQTIAELSGGFTSSGGLVLFSGACQLVSITDSNAQIRLSVDDEVKQISNVGISGTSSGQIAITYAEKLSEGSHKITIEANLATGATATLDADTFGKSYVRVIEFLV